MTQSYQTRGEVASEFGLDEDRIKVIKHGINPFLRPKPKPDDTFRIGSLGYLDPRKRFDLLIRAFLEADVDGELVIAGKHAEKLKARWDDERIIFEGFIPDHELVNFYNSLDAFIFPSLLEGYALPIVEAFACKVPVIALSDSIIPSDIKERTIVMDDLVKWFKDPDTSDANIKENYEFAKAHRWDRCAEQHLEVFREVSE